MTGDDVAECGCDEHACSCGGQSESQDTGDPADGPPDPQLDPTRSPGVGGGGPAGLADIEVSRDVTIGAATPADLTVSDTAPVADETTRSLLVRLMGDEAVERGRAALALADRAASERVVSALARAARTDDDADVRQFAVEALGRLADESVDATTVETAEAVSLAATRDDDPWVRAEAVVALDRLDRAAHADRLAAALADEHHAVRRNALISLFKRDGEAALDALLDGATDPDDRVREWAAHMLAGVDDARATAALRRLCADDVELVAVTARHSLSVDSARFRRRFTGALSGGRTVLPGEDLLNRQPDL